MGGEIAVAVPEIKLAIRGLRRNSAFTVAAIATLALGIGANTAMFSVVHAVLLRPLPGHETDRLIQICDQRRGACGYLQPELFRQLRERARSFTSMSADQSCRLNLTGIAEPEQLTARCTTANWFEQQQAQAMLGRTFLPEEDQHGRNRVVVLDYGYWRARFAGDESIIGKKLLLDNEPWIVIGVMPSGFRPFDSNQAPVYAGYVISEHPDALNVVGRLKPGVTLADAQGELNVLAAQLARSNPAWKKLKLRGVSVLEELTGPQRPLLVLLLGAVSFVLLIACVNVANLLLARSAVRQDEIEIRVALGASPRHIVKLVLIESLVLALASSVAALAVAWGGLRAAKPLLADLPRADEIGLDAQTLIWALLLGAITALLFGILPAVRSTRTVHTASMRSRTTTKSQRALVAGEVALAFVLLTGAGLLIRSFMAMRAVDLGFNPRNVLTNFLELPASTDGSRTAGARLYLQIRERVATLPGVQAVATASSVPMFGVSIAMNVQLEGQPARRDEHIASMDVISDDYFRVMGIRRVAGRAFTPSDRNGSTPVVIVSESIANRYFAGQALGRRIIVPELKFNIAGGKDVAAAIVGVVGNVCVHSVEDCDAEHIYLPEAQNALRMEHLLVRTKGDPLALATTVRRAVYQEAPGVPLDQPKTLTERASYLTDAPRRAMGLLGTFSGLAVLLAALGIYAVSSYLTTLRKQEIGIRMALGANAVHIAALVYRGIFLPSAAGLAVGLTASFWLMRLLKSLLFGVHSWDPVTLALVGFGLLTISLLAATGPALRAVVIDPSKVLRRE